MVLQILHEIVPVVALYVGPDQVMPVMSILATAMGMLMIFWNKVMNIFRKLFGMSKPTETSPPPTESKDETNKPQPPQS